MQAAATYYTKPGSVVLVRFILLLSGYTIIKITHYDSYDHVNHFI